MLIPPPQRKCDQYWPAEGQQEYGSFLVTVKSSRALAFYTQRTFAIRNVRAKKVGAADQSHRRSRQNVFAPSTILTMTESVSLTS